MSEITAERFLKDVARHQMTVHRDDGIYRHLEFRAAGPNNWNMWFEIITWPGTLVLGGDMGTWAFRRIDDMFSFFRESTLKINKPYWAEKCEAADITTGNPKQFAAPAYKRAIIGSLDNYDLEPEQRQSVIAALEDEVFRHEQAFPAYQALCEFEHEGFSFSDAWEISGEEYTGRFIWCLYAIVWGIQQFDARLVAVEEKSNG